MKFEAILALATALTVSPQADGDARSPEANNPSEAAICTREGEHNATLTSACVDAMTEWVMRRENAFFTIILDDTTNHYVQGIALADGGMQFEVPGPTYTQLSEESRRAVEAMSYIVDEDSGMYTLRVTGIDPRAQKPGEHTLTMARKLGFEEGVPITFRLYR